ncbi:Act1p [Histomonas meleagridis]|uniref:Act1p n=1 Tax=Histomonas meleagridis TaxID=135588 RepID=UPI00355A64AB|nr:Act1p [Histomonas meleagridis]KAH0800116.1 Act1p [Histomonas meleagridis]
MEVSTLVFDNGAYTIRAGLGGDIEPSCVIPSVVGWTKGATSPTNSDGSLNYFIGPESLVNLSAILLKRPIENRIITNFDDMEKLWNHIFTNELCMKPEEHPVLMTESPDNTKPAREKTLQIMMETFQIPAFYLSYPEVLSLFSAGITTGTVIDSGETLTHILPVFECFGMTHVQSKLEVGGRQLNGYLKKLILQSGVKLPSGYERESIRDIKEKLCYVATDIDAEMQKIEQMNASEKPFVLRNGQEIKITSQKFQCTEPLFEPELLQLESQGIPQLVFNAIDKCDDLKAQMFGNIMLTGGNSMFPGFAERLEKDISAIEKNEKVNVIALPNRKNAAWIGGSVLVSLATFSQAWITKAEYDEVGPSIMHLKCF